MSSTSFPNIPSYQIEEEIARGGMAVVYKGKHSTLDRTAAIKLLKSEMIENQLASKRFLKEPKIVAQFSHPNIVTIYDSGLTDEGQLYLAMEYLPGGTLKAKMKQGRLPQQQTIGIIKSVAEALDLAHSKGFVHRDIKPDNILFRENGTPVLTDFGIAKDLDGETQSTTAGTLLGTYRYMSPEQFQGQKPDGRSDLYSLGIMLVELLTGERPYDGKSIEALITKRLTEPVPELSEEFAVFQQVVEQLLAKEREHRFATAADLVKALADLEITLGFVKPESPTIPDAKASTKKSPQKPGASRTWAFAGFAAALIAGVAIFVYPAIQQMLQLQDVHAAMDKQIITLEERIAEFKQSKENYPQQVASAESELEQLRQANDSLAKEIKTSAAQQQKALDALTQQKAKFKQQLQEQQAELEQNQGRAKKALGAEENAIEDLREQLADLEQQSVALSSDYQKQSQKLNEDKQSLQQQIESQKSKIAGLSEQHKKDLSDEEKQLIELRTQLASVKEQYQSELDALSNNDTDIKQELEKLTRELDQEQKQFEAERTQLSQMIAETQQKLNQAQTTVEQLRKDFENFKQDEKSLIEAKQRELDIVMPVLAKLQKDLAPLVATYGETLSSDDKKRIEELLRKAESAFKKTNFTTPRSDNAVKWSEQILEIDSENEQAKATIGRVIDVYLKWVEVQKAGLLKQYFTPQQLARYEQLRKVKRTPRRSSNRSSNTTNTNSATPSEPEKEEESFGTKIKRFLGGEGHGQR